MNGPSLTNPEESNCNFTEPLLHMEDPNPTEPATTDCSFKEPDTQMQESSPPYPEASGIFTEPGPVTELPEELPEELLTMPRSPSPLADPSALEQTIEGFAPEELIGAVLKTEISEHPVQSKYPTNLPSFLFFAAGILVFEYTLLHWTETLNLLSEILNGVLWLGLISTLLPLMALVVKKGLEIEEFVCKYMRGGSLKHPRPPKSRALLITSKFLVNVLIIILELGLVVNMENLHTDQTTEWKNFAPSLTRFFFSFVWRQTISWTVLWMNMATAKKIGAMIEKFVDRQADPPDTQALQTGSASQEHIGKLGTLAKFIRGQLSKEQIEILKQEQELMAKLDKTRRQVCECHDQVNGLAIRVAEITKKDTAVGTGLSEATMADMRLLMDDE
ncbi:MAG: hypothetical protein LQ342_008113 [Letrouitia transgressa]|nr:MAG: hypothetical protein LQ342_008113 [Letrouitia transgressa]